MTPPAQGRWAREAWLVWSREHQAWWKAHRLGYTTHVLDAGLYTAEDAQEIVDHSWSRGACQEIAVPLYRLFEGPWFPGETLHGLLTPSIR